MLACQHGFVHLYAPLTPLKFILLFLTYRQTAATMTMNSPESMLELYRIANSPSHKLSTSNQALYTAELMREVGLKCIGFNGVPRTINVLGAFFGGLPSDVQTALKDRQPRRNLSKDNVDAMLARGNALWDSIYHPFSDKLRAKLAQSHPDLPEFIIEGEYGCLFSDPPTSKDSARPEIGRVLTSVVAVACLRSQSGVGPQVVSHVFGLRKAFEDGSAESEEEVPGGKWLASNEGSLWLLEQIDSVVHALGQGQGTTFAPGFEKAPRAKL